MKTIIIALVAACLMVGCAREVVVQTVPITVTVPVSVPSIVYKDREPAKPTKEDQQKIAEKRLAEKKEREAAAHEERMRQSRIAFNKESQPVQQSCHIALNQIKSGSELMPEQIQMLFQFYHFHEPLIEYLNKAADKNGFDTLIKITGSKDAERIAKSKLVFGGYTSSEQKLIVEAAQNLKKGDGRNHPDVIKMLEGISILKELVDKFYDK